MTAHDSGWKWWLAFSFLPDSHRLHWHQLAWRTQWTTSAAVDHHAWGSLIYPDIYGE